MGKLLKGIIYIKSNIGGKNLIRKRLVMVVILVFIGIAPGINDNLVSGFHHHDDTKVTIPSGNTFIGHPGTLFIKKLEGVMGGSWHPYLDVMTGYCLTNSKMNIGRFVIHFPIHNPFNESGKGFFLGRLFFGRFGAIVQYNLSIPWIPCVGYGKINDTHFYWKFWSIGQLMFEHTYYYIYGNVSDAR